MPRQSTSKLPKGVANKLPKHAQDIFKKTYNKAYNTYADPKKRQNKSSTKEQAAAKVAWSAVKNKYRKNAKGEWVVKD